MNLKQKNQLSSQRKGRTIEQQQNLGLQTLVEVCATILIIKQFFSISFLLNFVPRFIQSFGLSSTTNALSRLLQLISGARGFTAFSYRLDSWSCHFGPKVATDNLCSNVSIDHYHLPGVSNVHRKLLQFFLFPYLRKSVAFRSRGGQRRGNNAWMSSSAFCQIVIYNKFILLLSFQLFKTENLTNISLLNISAIRYRSWLVGWLDEFRPAGRNEGHKRRNCEADRKSEPTGQKNIMDARVSPAHTFQLLLHTPLPYGLVPINNAACRIYRWPHH